MRIINSLKTIYELIIGFATVERYGLIKNAVKSKRIVAEKLEVSLTPEISSPA